MRPMTTLAGTRYNFNPSTFDTSGSYLGSIPGSTATQYSTPTTFDSGGTFGGGYYTGAGTYGQMGSVGGGAGTAATTGATYTGSTTLPGQPEDPLTKYARIGSVIGEAAHGVGNIINAAKGRDMQPYPGKTLAQQAEAAKRARMQEKLFEQLLGSGPDPMGERTAREAAEDAQVSG